MAGAEEIIPLTLSNLRGGGGDNDDRRSSSESDDDDQVSYYSRYFTIDDALQQIGFGRYQFKLLLILGFLSVSDALEVMILSVLSPALRCDWQLSSSEIAFVSTAIFFGMLLGAAIWGKLSDVYGRWPILLLAMFTISYFGFLTSISPTYWALIFLRFMVGFGTVGTAQGFILFAEIIPPKHRGKILVLSGVFWASGNVLEIFASGYIIPRFGWRALIVFTASLGLVSMCFFGLVPESPRYYLAKGWPARAERILRDMARENRGKMPHGKLQALTTSKSSHGRAGMEKSKRGQLSDLFTNEYRRTTMQLWAAWFTMAFGYYGVVLASSELLERGRVCEGTGANSTAQHIKALSELDECGCHPFSSSDYSTLLFSSVGEYLNIGVNLLLLDRIGRKPTLAFHLIGASLSMLLMMRCSTRSTLALLMFFSRSFVSGVGAVGYVYTSEVYPTTFRALGLGVCSSVARFGSMASPYVAQVLMDRSPKLALSVYALVFALAAINALTLPIETTGRHLKETKTTLARQKSDVRRMSSLRDSDR